MKFWRTITVAGLVALVGLPAFAGGHCEPDLDPLMTFPLVLCVERETTTVGPGAITPPTAPGGTAANLFPFTNLSATFPSYRNQYLYPAGALQKLAQRGALTIDSVHARTSTYAAPPAAVMTYTGGNFDVYTSTLTALSTTMDNNNLGNVAPHLVYAGAKTVTLTSPSAVSTDPASGIEVGSTDTTINLSDFSARAGTVGTRNDLTTPIDVRATYQANQSLFIESIMLGVGGSGGLVGWDVTSGACSEPKRAYGSGPTFNPGAGSCSAGNSRHLCTAFGIDNNAFVWVFKGLALPGPSTIQQQIAEIIRLLITPEGLRCAGLDIVPDGALIEEPFNFPAGKDYDAISPQVTNGGILTGEETGDGSQRRQGWRP